MLHKCHWYCFIGGSGYKGGTPREGRTWHRSGTRSLFMGKRGCRVRHRGVHPDRGGAEWSVAEEDGPVRVADIDE